MVNMSREAALHYWAPSPRRRSWIHLLCMFSSWLRGFPPGTLMTPPVGDWCVSWDVLVTCSEGSSTLCSPDQERVRLIEAVWMDVIFVQDWPGGASEAGDRDNQRPPPPSPIRKGEESLRYVGQQRFARSGDEYLQVNSGFAKTCPRIHRESPDKPAESQQSGGQ